MNATQALVMGFGVLELMTVNWLAIHRIASEATG